MSSIYSALIAPNFTEFGYGLTKAPEALTKHLAGILNNAVEEGDMRMEEPTDSINGEPMFVDLDAKLRDQAILMLQPILEAWSGAELQGSFAYGLRVYRNESTLNMHIDKVETHVVSAIMHVDHDKNSEPWPLVIEDLKVSPTWQPFFRLRSIMLNVADNLLIREILWR